MAKMLIDRARWPRMQAPGRSLVLLAKRGGLPVLDQGIISLGNFLTTVLIARVLAPHEFGMITLAFVALYAFNAVQGSLLLGPFGVLSAGRTPAGYIDYTTSLGLGQVGLAVLVLVLCLGAGMIAGTPTTLLGFVAVGLAGLAWQLQEFSRRVLYAEDRVGGAVLNDLIDYGGQLLVTAALIVAGRLDAVTAMLGIALTSAVAAALGILQVRRSLTGSPSRDDLRQTFAYGRWLLGGEIALIVSTRLYTYLAAFILGSSAAGVVGAVITTVNPLNLVIFSVATVVPIRLARVRAARGSDAANRALIRLHLLTTPPVVVVCLLLAVFAEPILSLVYGGRYDGYGSLVAVLAAFTMVRYHSTLVGAGLWVFRETRGVFAGHAAAAVVTLPIGYVLVSWLGLMGVPVGMLVSVLTFTAVWWWYYLRARARSRAEEADGAMGGVDGEPSADQLSALASSSELGL